VRDRLARLSGPARSAATAAAALGHPSRATVSAALDPNTDVEGALLEAEEAGVLVWEEDRLRFAHPLLASALSGSLTIGKRRALHRRLADAVVDPEERARHLARSIVTPNEDVAREIEDAAAVAARRGAPDAAAELFEAARRLTPPGDSESRARRLLGGADAVANAGDLSASRHLAEEALAAARSARLRARVLLLLGDLASYTGTIEERIAAHEAALAEVDDDPRLRAQILVALGEQVTIDPRRAAQRADEAVAILRDLGDRSSLARALMNRLIAGAVVGEGAPADLLDEIGALETASPGRGGFSLIWSSWMDDVEATRDRYRTQVNLARDEGDQVAAAELAEFMAMVEFRAGDWATAEQRLEVACETLEQLDIGGPIAASLADRSLIDAHRGRIDRARRTMEDILPKLGPDLFWRAVCLSAVGEVEFIAGDLAAADEAWTTMREIAESLGWNEFPEDRSEPNHIEATLALGQRERALELLAHLEWRGRTLPRRWIEATLPRARAMVTAGQGQLDEALAILRAAPAVDGLPFERARLLLVQGQLERRANRKLAARDSFTEALAIFDRLGSPPWAARARAEMNRLGLRHRGRDELTATERRIAELVATGMTNRQVAESAFVSPKTVEANLSRIYGKLGIRSRAELGARMATDQRTRPSKRRETPDVSGTARTIGSGRDVRSNADRRPADLSH
jgi:DNA-binding CsgD family transcriptional regulator